MGPTITATQLNYFHICKYKLWLFSNGISMEHTSGLVEEGKVLHTTAYAQRPKKYREIMLGGSKIDFYDPKKKVIFETKRSPAMQLIDVWQVKFYIFLFEKSGIFGVTGKIEYPYTRQRKIVSLDDRDKLYLEKASLEVINIIAKRSPPVKERKAICDSCAYHDFCWVVK
jgi:CRISPR-associated exonuclease Cas4